MSEVFGHKVVLRVDGSNVMCFRSLTLTKNGEVIDLTDSCSNGWRELATENAVQSVDLGVEAILKQRTLREKMFSGGSIAFQNAELVYPRMDGGSGDGDILSGTFVVSAYSEGIPFDNVVTISGTLQSSGPVTYTPEV